MRVRGVVGRKTGGGRLGEEGRGTRALTSRLCGSVWERILVAPDERGRDWLLEERILVAAFGVGAAD